MVQFFHRLADAFSWPASGDVGDVVDHVDSAKRSLIMAAVHSKHTKPEVVVRKIAYGLGYRYRLHAKNLPGRPDLVFPGKRKAIFVHGCFWHRHTGCRYATSPKTRVQFWESKFQTNVDRDRRNVSDLESLGWKVLTVWQCELKKLETLTERLNEFLG
jgi:DNA mismatch endonuclease (patch repair protein)